MSRHFGIPPQRQRFPDRYYKPEPIIKHTTKRDCILCAVIFVIAIIATMYFGVF